MYSYYNENIGLIEKINQNSRLESQNVILYLISLKYGFNLTSLTVYVSLLLKSYCRGFND